MTEESKMAYRLEALKLAKELLVGKMYMPKELAIGTEGIQKEGHTDTEGCVHQLAFVTIEVAQIFEEYLETGSVEIMDEDDKD